MGYWLFMLAVDLLLPVLMIAIGISFGKTAPKNINPFIGYRTAMSMKNEDTWRFAHHFCGKLWQRWGFWMLPLSVLPMLLVLGKGIDAVSIVGTVVCCLQLVPMLVSIAVTEKALKKTFDRNGQRLGENDDL